MPVQQPVPTSVLIGGAIDTRFPHLGPAVLYTNVTTGAALEEAMEPFQSHPYAKVDPMQALKGEGFIVIASDANTQVQEYKTLDEAQEQAISMLDRHGAVVVYEAVAIIRPKKDIVARFTKRGAELQSGGAGGAALPSGEVPGNTSK